MRMFHTGYLAFAVFTAFGIAAQAQVADFGLGSPSKSSAGEPTYKAKLFVVEGSKEGVLELTMELPEGWKTYAVTHPKGGIGVPSSLRLDKKAKKIEKPKELDLVGPWTPAEEPQMDEVDGEQHLIHYGKVTWKSRIQLADGADASKLSFKIYYSGQMCSDKAGVCMPIGEDAAVSFAGNIKKEEVEKLPKFAEQKKKD